MGDINDAHSDQTRNAILFKFMVLVIVVLPVIIFIFTLLNVVRHGRTMKQSGVEATKLEKTT